MFSFFFFFSSLMSVLLCALPKRTFMPFLSFQALLLTFRSIDVVL